MDLTATLENQWTEGARVYIGLHQRRTILRMLCMLRKCAYRSNVVVRVTEVAVSWPHIVPEEAGHQV